MIKLNKNKTVQPALNKCYQMKPRQFKLGFPPKVLIREDITEN